MLHVGRIVFIDDETGKEISVSPTGEIIASSPSTTNKEACFASFHAGLMISGAKSEITKLATKH